MTREPIPPFDLYAELEVSRSASVATIEAAYRALAKVHHPDVADPADDGAPTDERIKRLNLAREWLTDPDRRRRYDASTGAHADGVRRAGAPGSAGARGSGGIADATRPGPPDWSAPDRAHFGVNAEEVRQYLADLRVIDAARAAEVRQGLRVAEAAGRAVARKTAFAASRAKRLTDWLYAREAATIIVRTRLPEAATAPNVADALADVAGAIAIRDLIPPSDFDLLLVPWTWRGERILEGGPGTALDPSTRSVADAAGPTLSPGAPARPRRHVGALTGLSASLVALVGILAITTLGGAFQPGAGQGLAAASFDQVVAGADAGTPTPGPAETPANGPSESPIASPATIDPALLADLQAGAASMIQRLRRDARLGDLFDARRVLGTSAPHLTVAGLMRATFPSVTAADIAIAKAGDGWLATVGTDTLTSSDGKHWTFDYGERPLAVYGKAPEHTLYFLVPGGQHDIYVTVTSVVVTRSTVRATLSWRFASTSDAASFVGDRLTVASLTFGDASYAVVGGPSVRLGGTVLKTTLSLPVTAIPASRGTIDVRVSNTSRPFQVVDSVFKLQAL